MTKTNVSYAPGKVDGYPEQPLYYPVNGHVHRPQHYHRDYAKAVEANHYRLPRRRVCVLKPRNQSTQMHPPTRHRTAGFLLPA